MKKNLSILSLFFLLTFLTIATCGQQIGEVVIHSADKNKDGNIFTSNLVHSEKFTLRQSLNPTRDSDFQLKNPLVLNSSKGCAVDNLTTNHFDEGMAVIERLNFCRVLESVLTKLKVSWSAELKNEINQIWQILLNENIKIRSMKRGVSSKILASAAALDDGSTVFNASFYLRPERFQDKSFALVFMHELRHIYDFYVLWKSKSSITQAEFEKRGFRIMGKIYRESPDRNLAYKMPDFWDDSWKFLSEQEIADRRERKIEKFMLANPFYKRIIKLPTNYYVGFTTRGFEQNAAFVPVKENKGERLPNRIEIFQSKEPIVQKVKTLSFDLEKANDKKNPDDLLKSALVNEKNLFYRMNNFVYDQDLQLECWKNQRVTENYRLNYSIARTTIGTALIQSKNTSAMRPENGKTVAIPTCVNDLEMIRTDATETFWAAPYLDQMPIKFEGFTELNGIKVARYTVLQPSSENLNLISSLYSRNQSFRVFVGSIFITIEDAPQIIKFWGTSYSKAELNANKNKTVYGNYSATAIREKLSSGIWVTTLLNTVAVTNEKKLKPFSYVVKYANFKQSNSDVVILDN